VGSYDAKLYCIDRITGQVKWQYFAGAPIDVAPAVTASSIYQFVAGRGVAAVDKTTGSFNRQPRWIVKDARQFLSEDEKNVYLRRGNNTIVAVDKATGEERFASNTPFDLYAANEEDGIMYGANK